MLDKQIKIYNPDTGDFYSNTEKYLDDLKKKLGMERKFLKEGGTDYNTGRKFTGLVEIAKEIEKKNIIASDLLKGNVSYDGLNDDIIALCEKYIRLSDLLKMKNKKIKQVKKRLLDLLKNKTDANIASNGKHQTRSLNPSFLNKPDNIITVFDSSFTRLIGAVPDELSEDFMVVQVYYFDVIKDLIYHGFTYKGEKYIFFTASAGQIRTKKTVFVKESVWNKHEKTIMCGLTLAAINAKGGNNPNKHLAYMALNNSATDVWEGFNIDKTIVIDDFETEVFGTYDFVDDVEYTIKRISDYIPITHTDGAGMMLPCMGKNRMVRLPWVKGLLGVFDFVKFIKENNCSPIIKDIYGKEHDVIAEDIQIIFTKSQFKLWKYYDSWEQYKEYYKKYGCTAGYANIERDRIPDATINYQMLQSLTDITDEEIEAIAYRSVNKLEKLCNTVDGVKSSLGIHAYNDDMTALQKSIKAYPELRNDAFIKEKIKQIKDSLVKSFKGGKLRVKGKYTFLLPDFYAACEYWFGCIKNPKGLLDDGEVFCWLYKKNEELDCLRSPHLYREHAIRKNIACKEYGERQEKLRKWFQTDALYTSCHDFISKMLQFDVDGDVSLVVSDDTIISVAKRNMRDIVPLYYNMKKASPSILNNETIYNGLSAAFTGSNIGQYSNNISKIWNSDVFVSGTDEEKQEALTLIRLLCAENNLVIDYAKTLYKPTRPKEIGNKIKEFTKAEVPHFFKYAKDKERTEKKNQSFVNKLDDIIPNPRISSKSWGLEKPEYILLMTNPDIEVSEDAEIIKSYIELNRKYQYTVITNKGKSDDDNLKDKRNDMGYHDYMNTVNADIINEVRTTLSQFGTDAEIADILVKYLYGMKDSKYKNVLWMCYGDILYTNLICNLKKCQEIKKKDKKVSVKKKVLPICKASDTYIFGYKRDICRNCGKEMFFPRKVKAEEKLCPDCFENEYQKEIEQEKTIPEEITQEKTAFDAIAKNVTIQSETKEIQCIDCGEWFEVSKYDSATCRCEECQKEYRKISSRQRMKRYRERKRNVTSTL